MLLGTQATWHTQSVAHCLRKIRKNLLFIATYVVQFHNIGDISTQIPCRSVITRSKPKITQNELAYHRCRTRTNCMDAVMRVRNLAHQKAEKKFLGHWYISLTNGTGPGKTGRMGATVLCGKKQVNTGQEQPFIVKHPITTSYFGSYQSIVRLYIIICDMKLRSHFWQCIVHVVCTLLCI